MMTTCDHKCIGYCNIATNRCLNVTLQPAVFVVFVFCVITPEDQF